MMAMELHNQPVVIEIKYDQQTDRMRVIDTYGEFIPFPLGMWHHFVEGPWRRHFRFTKTSYQRVVEIFIGEYKHRYICNN